PSCNKSGLQMFVDATAINMPFADQIKPEAFNHIWKDGVPYIVAGEKTAEEVLNKAMEIQNSAENSN
ncbi:hypothetical protein, partial [Vallitalea sediminicola]